MKFFVLALCVFVLSLDSVLASTLEKTTNFTHTSTGIASIVIFIVAYFVVALEDRIHLKKSVPVITAAGFIWMLVAITFKASGSGGIAAIKFQESVVEFAELFLFLLASMTFINSMQVFNVFEAMRAAIIRMRLTFKGVFWLTGFLSFFISSFANNLTTALVMGSIVIAVAHKNKQFIIPSCISIVVASNAGGAFTPFGDVTSLMIWQSGKLDFSQFFYLFLPSVTSWLIPAFFLYFAIPNEKPRDFVGDAHIADGGYVIIALFLLSIVFSIIANTALGLPPVVGMMMGFGLLQLYSWAYSKRITFDYFWSKPQQRERRLIERAKRKFDIFNAVEKSEWDTLLFFYGVVLCVGGLAAMGYMGVLSKIAYTNISPLWANIAFGIVSAIVDNIPVVASVIAMNPPIDMNEWLLVALTTAIGGSLLSIGSAAGVAMMGQVRGYYTFLSHLKWSWAIVLGYAISIMMHLWTNGY